MKIDMNKDFDEAFPSEFMLGFTLKQFVVAAIALVVGITGMILLHFQTGLGIVECSYIIIPVSGPICMLGFAGYQMQTPLQYIREILYVRKTRELLYEAEELQGEGRVFTMKSRCVPDKKRNQRRRKGNGKN